jgi:hypothetical protein
VADVKANYPAASDATITLASLASDTNLLAGRESTALDNSSNLYLDYLVSGKITTGTSPTTARSIQVWVVGSWDGTTWPDVFDGTDSTETITSANHKNSVCRFLAEMATDATSDRVYHFGPVSLASAFGGVMPVKVVFFVVHNTAVNLNSTAGNHQVRIQPYYETVT